MVREAIEASTALRVVARLAAAGRMMTPLLLLTAVLVARPAAAADETSGPWVFEAYLSIFVPTNVSGLDNFPPPPGGDDVSVSNGVVSLNSAFIGGFAARHDRWGVYSYLIYMDLVGTRSGSDVIDIGGRPLPGQTTATAHLRMRDSYGLLAGTYRLVTDPGRPLDLVFGARLFDQHRTLDWQVSGNVGSLPPSSLSGSRSVSQSGGDAILGLTGRFGPTGRGWFAPYYLDVGTGNSNLTWQVNAGVGYGWGWGETVVGWRYMYYKFPADRQIDSVGLNGPVFILLFRW